MANMNEFHFCFGVTFTVHRALSILLFAFFLVLLYVFLLEFCAFFPAIIRAYT